MKTVIAVSAPGEAPRIKTYHANAGKGNDKAAWIEMKENRIVDRVPIHLSSGHGVIDSILVLQVEDTKKPEDYFKAKYAAKFIPYDEQ